MGTFRIPCLYYFVKQILRNSAVFVLFLKIQGTSKDIFFKVLGTNLTTFQILYEVLTFTEIQGLFKTVRAL